MKDNQKKYLDKVTELIVRETIIDYDNKTLTFPFYSSPLHFSFFSQLFDPSNVHTTPFSDYSEHTYGIVGEEEMEYVWNQYRDIINDIIEDIY